MDRGAAIAEAQRKCAAQLNGSYMAAVAKLHKSLETGRRDLQTQRDIADRAVRERNELEAAVRACGHGVSP